MSFDHLAPHYRWMERVLAGETLQHARTAWLPEAGQPRRALLAGEGNGRFLQAALEALPTTCFVCVDASSAMLRIAQESIPPHDRTRVAFEHASLPGWHARPERFDLIVTHCFLDCFPEPELAAVVHQLATAASEKARWLLADFTLPPRGVARWRARLIHAAMYAFFRAATRLPARHLVPPDPFLTRHGFHRRFHREFEWGLVRSELWQRGESHRRADPHP